MVYKVISQIQNGEELLLGTRGAEELELDINDIDYFSDNKKMRYVALRKRGIFRLTLDSYKALKRELTKRGIIWRFNFEKR